MLNLFTVPYRIAFNNETIWDKIESAWRGSSINNASFGAPRPGPPPAAPLTEIQMRTWTPEDARRSTASSLAQWRANAIPEPTPQRENNWPIIAAVTAAGIAALVVLGGNR